MRYLLLPLLLLCSISASYSQEYFFPLKVGASLTYKSYDAKGKPAKVDKKDDWLSYTVKNVEVKKDTTYINVFIDGAMFQAKESKDNPVMKAMQQSTLKVYDGKFSMNMQPIANAMNALYAQLPEGATTAVSESKDAVFPLDLKQGVPLADYVGYKQELKISNGGMSFSVETIVEVKNRKIEGQEDITTPAGTFSCFKYSYDAFMTMGGIMGKQQSTLKIIEWLNPKLGVVKGEEYNEKGKLQSRVILEKVEM